MGQAIRGYALCDAAASASGRLLRSRVPRERREGGPDGNGGDYGTRGPGEIRINDDEAVIEVNGLAWREVLMRLYAVHEDGRWGIARSNERRGS